MVGSCWAESVSGLENIILETYLFLFLLVLLLLPVNLSEELVGCLYIFLPIISYFHNCTLK